MKCTKNFLFISLFYALLNFVCSQATIFDANNTGTKSIYCDGKIIYILTATNNNEIKIYQNDEMNTHYSNRISAFKDILKKDETSFIIIGISQDYQICHQIFNINGNELVTESTNPYCTTELSPLSKLEGKYINDNKFIIYCLIGKNFMIYVLDLKSGGGPSRTETVSTAPADAPDFTPYIKCDSFSGNDYFCIYFYQKYKEDKGDYYWSMYYTYGNFNKKISGMMCDELCRYGNVIKINDSKEKYLVCYIKFSSNN